MKRTTPELNKVWGRTLRAALMILPLSLSGCFDDKKTDPPSADSFGLAVSVTGSGSVSSSPTGILCPGDCSETLAAGGTITLTAAPASSSTFTGWGGDCSGSTPSCTLTMSASRAVTASFIFSIDPPPPAAQYTLSVNVTGSGSVSSSPAGITCGADCTENYVDGTNVTLTAAANPGSTFAGWSGACSGTASCVVAMSAARSVTASFTLNQYGLTVQKLGSGSGNVTSIPAGINCGSDCSENYSYGTSVTLAIATSDVPQFSGWGNACTGTQTTCTVLMTEARTVSASFTLGLRALAVTVNGMGSVASAPAGITCGTDCTENYAHGSNVALTASPGADQQFSGWLGACSGTQTTCTVSMTEARSVTAAFAPVQRGLTVSVVGSGSVTSSPAGITCGTDCTESYDHGALVTLTALPVMGFQLSGWSGACTATTGTCAVTMNATQSVTATFTASNGSAQLLWDAPTANSDGSALADLAGYTLRYGTATGNYPQSINLPLNVVTCSGTAPTVCNHTVNGLSAGTWYFTVQAYDVAGNISTNSNEATRSVP